jgi:hypothetical protein
LVSKKRHGKEQVVSITPKTLSTALKYLESFEEIWENRLESLDGFLKNIKVSKKGKK